MAVNPFLKDPNAVIDFAVDWSQWLLAGETIQTSSFTVETGITKEAESSTTTKATVWLSGGTAGICYRVTNRVITSQGRTDDRTLLILARER